MSASEGYEDIDAAKVLDVAEDASEADIRKAYRKRSLKVHPDRNPNNPTAAEEFHKLTIAAEILLDPSKRAQLADLAKAKRAKAERFAKFDSRRQDMQADLERREELAAQEKRNANIRKRDAQTELERIREQGKRMRMDKTQQLNEDLERERKLGLDGGVDEKDKEEEHAQDKVVRIKWSRKDRPAWTTPSVDSNTDAIKAAMSMCGHVSQVILPPLKQATASGKKPKSASGIVEYSDILGAFSAVQSSNRGVLQDVVVSWVGGVEPMSIQHLRSTGKLHNADATTDTNQDTTQNSYSSAPSFDFNTTAPQPPPSTSISYETETLMRMKERERLKQQILQEEGDE